MFCYPDLLGWFWIIDCLGFGSFRCQQRNKWTEGDNIWRLLKVMWNFAFAPRTLLRPQVFWREHTNPNTDSSEFQIIIRHDLPWGINQLSVSNPFWLLTFHGVFDACLWAHGAAADSWVQVGIRGYQYVAWLTLTSPHCCVVSAVPEKTCGNAFCTDDVIMLPWILERLQFAMPKLRLLNYLLFLPYVLWPVVLKFFLAAASRSDWGRLVWSLLAPSFAAVCPPETSRQPGTKLWTVLFPNICIAVRVLHASTHPSHYSVLQGTLVIRCH